LRLVLVENAAEIALGVSGGIDGAADCEEDVGFDIEFGGVFGAEPRSLKMFPVVMWLGGVRFFIV
jgi:hypothetical protein